MAVHIDYIIKLLAQENAFHNPNSLSPIMAKDFEQPDIKRAVQEVYQDLGGIGDFPVPSLHFDIELLSKGVKFDTGLSYNKYRTVTLRSELYQQIPFYSVNNMKRYCRQYEKDCLKAGVSGDKWTNNIAKKFFGESNEPGDLGLNGSAQWKFNAFKEFLLDVSQLVKEYRVVRLSIYDSIMIGGQVKSLNELLMSRNGVNDEFIKNFVLRKII